MLDDLKGDEPDALGVVDLILVGYRPDGWSSNRLGNALSRLTHIHRVDRTDE